ncbi:MAG: hypothetical protein WC661_16440 [Opitutaceae bacterium]|jgi:hypothetical protein
MKTLHPILLIASFGLATCASAVEIRFLVGEGSEDALKFVDNGKTVSIRADENDLSGTYVFTGAGPLVLFKEVVRDGKTRRETAASLAVPAGLKNAIIILTGGKSGAYAGTWVDDSSESRQAGTVRTVNLSRHTVTFNMETSVFTVAPGENHQVAFPSQSDHVVLRAKTQVNGRTEIIAGNPVPMRPGLRLLLILRDGLPSPGRKTNIVDILSFYDQPPVRPSPAAPDASGGTVASPSSI